MDSPRPLRLLLLEDVEDDAALVVLELRRAGYDPEHERVAGAAAMIAALDRKSWELVISDYSMPGFDAPAALRLLQERGLDLPFIIVSGTIGEDTAVAAMRAGAHDYLAKGQLARLGPAVDRELREADVRADRRRAEEQLLVSDRMASLGTLAAGMAHEINNPLAAIVANLDFISKELAVAEKDRTAAADVLSTIGDPLRDAREGADRVREIMRDLRLFSRAEQGKRGHVDVHGVLDSTLRMAWNEIRHRARLVKEFGEIPLVDADEARLGQVFLSLLINAAQSIPDGHADRNEIRIATRAAADGRVLIEVRDTGEGIPRETLRKLFTPFFTTRPPGAGTGLGLSICHRLVTSMGGEITIESETGQGSGAEPGTTVRVLLLAARDEERTEAAPAATGPAPARRGRVLIVDDEAIIVRAVQRGLSRAHDVVPAFSGKEALALLSKETFDVILCDLMMPEMTGMELFARIGELHPTQAAAVIFLTGGAFTPAARTFLEETKNPRLEKPFDSERLLAMIGERVRQNQG